MSEFYNDEDPALCLIYFDLIIPSINIICLCSMIPAIYKYVKLRSKMMDKGLFWTGLIFFIFVFLSLVHLTFDEMYFCRDISVYTITHTVTSLIYSIQTLLLLAVLFIRLYFVFDGTMFALSPTLIKSYWIIYIFTIILTVCAGIFYSNSRRTFIGLLIVGSGFLMVIIIMVILIILFLYKLIQVYKSVDGDPELIAIITKTSLLAIISTSSTIILAMITLITPSSESIHFVFLNVLFVTNDFVTNFWCIILSYTEYSAWYLKLCKCCDNKCKWCWYRIVGKDITMLTKQIEMNQNTVYIE